MRAMSSVRNVRICLGLLAVVFFSSVAAAQTVLPPLPDYIKSREVLRVGVRCDQPPFSYQDQNGKHAGIEVDMALKIAEWAFASKDKVELTCVTAENRIPQLNAKRVDLLLATLGVYPERARVVDFSTSYNWGGSDLLVLKDSPIKKLDDVDDRKVIMLKGTSQAKWFETNKPNVETLKLNSAADALQALKQGRGDAYTHDVATLSVMAARDPGLRLVGEWYDVGLAAAGVRKNESEWLAYVNASLARMKEENLFAGWINKWVAPEGRGYYIDVFTKPRPAGR